MAINLRSEKEIERMRQLFASIGAGAELPPCENPNAALLLTPAEQSRKVFEVSERCGKLSYPTESDAMKVIKARKKRGSGNLRSYRCEDCKAFHISSYFSKR